ncbi:DUF3267 domain-containing protein [Paenibacillus ginsengihumi]|mgnify:CR=1 FL=1|uniref:DUF3267 domain-containing protein n=1 Tax=Paenibacillus ginsengihumi TaxID=431596 RepID=UPI00037BD13C|nr:DUF3267 domain-containing protein [Paenibacillus ginsengihumi]
MKLLFGLPKPDPEREEAFIQEQWKRVKEPKTMLATILLSIPMMAVAGVVTWLLIGLFRPMRLSDYGFGAESITLQINPIHLVWLLALLLVHELIHLLLVPKVFQSEKTWLGLTLFGGFVLTEETMTRRRYLVITLAPFVVISVIGPLVIGALGWLTPAISFLMLLNALGSSVDLLSAALIVSQVPSKARVTNRVTKTFWKM